MEREAVHNNGGNETQTITGICYARQFFKDTLAIGTHYKMRDNLKGFFRKEWVIDVKMTRDYLFTDAPYYEVGEEWGLSGNKLQLKNKVYLRVKRTLRRLYGNSPEDIKQKYIEVSERVLGKPVSSRAGLRISRAKGGVSIIVKPQALQGKSRKEIVTETGLTASQVSSVLYEERKKGNLPVSRVSECKKALDELLKKTQLNLEEREAALLKISDRLLDNNSLFVGYRQACREIGIEGYIPKNEVLEFLSAMKSLVCPSRVVMHGNRRIFFLRDDINSLKVRLSKLSGNNTNGSSANNNH